jgi:hypothetical protein
MLLSYCGLVVCELNRPKAAGFHSNFIPSTFVWTRIGCEQTVESIAEIDDDRHDYHR